MINNYDIAVLSEKVAYLEAAIKNAGIELPEVTSEDNGKTLQVVAGKWDKGNKIPSVVNALDSTSTTDALSAAQGKALNEVKVGEWVLVNSGAANLSIALPTSWKEILVDIEYNGVHLITIHPYNIQSASDSGVSFGNYGTSYAIGVVSQTSARASQVNWGGNNVTTESTLTIYYR